MAEKLRSPELLSRLTSAQSFRLDPDMPTIMKVACETLDKMNIKNLEIDLRAHFDGETSWTMNQGDASVSVTSELRNYITR
jgi:hypothetical protein